MCQSDGTIGTTTSGQPSKTSTTWQMQTQSPWQCYQCNLMNSNLMNSCLGCFASKFHSTFDLSRGYSHLSDNDLAAIILNSNRSQLHDIAASLELQAAVYSNHSFLSLLIDIGRINLIFVESICPPLFPLSLDLLKCFKCTLFHYSCCSIKDSNSH